MKRCIAVNPAVYELTHGGGAGCDNMTVIVVALTRGKSIAEWQSTIAKRWAALENPPIVGPEPVEKEVTKSGFWCCTYEVAEGPTVQQGRARGDRPPIAGIQQPQPQMQIPVKEKVEDKGVELAVLGEVFHLDPKELEIVLKRPMTLDDINLTFADIGHKFPHYE